MIEVEFTAAVQAEQPARTIAGLAVPFGKASAPESLTGARYLFSGPPDNADEELDVVRGHDDDRVIGRVAVLEAQEDGLHAVARVFATTVGNDALVEASEGVLTGFSIGAEIAEFAEGSDGVRTVGKWQARHLGLVRKPAFSQARGLKVAAEERKTMTESPPVTPLPTSAELIAEVTQAVQANMEAAFKTGRHPLAQFATEAAYWAAFQDADIEEQSKLRAAFAVPDQITGDNPGLMAPQWRSGIKQRLDDRRPAIRQVGAVNLPDSGMVSNWAYLDPALSIDTIIAQQTAEKTDLAGIKISVLTANKPIKTAGTVSDISYQLLRRSSPAYLNTYLEVCRAAYARYTERTFELALTAGGTASAVGAVTTGNAFRKWLFGASQAVEDATGAPATVIGVSRDTWLLLGGLDDLFNSQYGTQNVSGTSDASSLSINVNGLAITCWPFLAPKKVIATNGLAAKFAEQGPFLASAEDVRKLGQDVAVWGMYEDAEIYFPTGVIVGTIT